MKKFLFLFLFFFIINCGYQPIYLNKNPDKFKFSKISLEGNSEINKKIINSASIKEVNNNLTNNEIILDSTYKIEETSKNSKGQITSYRTTLTTNLQIKKGEQILKAKTFSRDITYSNRKNKFDLVEYQNEIKDEIISQLVEEMILFINLE